MRPSRQLASKQAHTSTSESWAPLSFRLLALPFLFGLRGAHERLYRVLLGRVILTDLSAVRFFIRSETEEPCEGSLKDCFNFSANHGTSMHLTRYGRPESEKRPVSHARY